MLQMCVGQVRFPFTTVWLALPSGAWAPGRRRLHNGKRDSRADMPMRQVGLRRRSYCTRHPFSTRIASGVTDVPGAFFVKLGKASELGYTKSGLFVMLG